MWVIALLETLKAMFSFGEKITPPDEIRVEKHTERKELREQDFNQQVINDSFNYLKRRTEIDTWDYVRDVHASMTPEQMMNFHKILQARVYQYRYDRPVIYRNWIKENPKK